MRQIAIPAAFIRGGTSNGLFFRGTDLPAAPAEWDPIFLAAIGSPDANGRQLDGMGGGISSLSKVVVVGPASRPDADVDYTFGQVAVDAPLVDYRSNCGNLTSAVGPFAVDEGLVDVADGEVLVRLHNTNSGKIIHARFTVEDGRAAVDGDFELQGVAGRAAPIRLEFLDPGGAVGGALLPTGNVVDLLRVPEVGDIEASLIDATTAGVFVRAADLGLSGPELPDALEADAGLLRRIEKVRRAAGALMGLPPDSQSVPKIGFVAPPCEASTLSGATVSADDMNLCARMMSMGRPHRALPLTGAMCLSVAAAIEGTVPNQLATPARDGAGIAVSHPSGVLPLDARVRRGEGWIADGVIVFRTARRLMQGQVMVAASRLSRGQAAADHAARTG